MNQRLAGLVVGVLVLGSCGAGGEVSIGAARRSESVPVSSSAPATPVGVAPTVPATTTPIPTSTTQVVASTTQVVAPAATTSVPPAPAFTEVIVEPPPTVETVPPPAFFPVPAVAPGEEAGAFAAFDQVVGDATIGRGALTVGIAMAYNGEIVHEAAYGLEDARNGVLPTITSRYRIASLSKILAASAIMQLVEQGVVSLDETPLVGLGLPIADGRMANVTVRELLSHTSGFPQAEPIYFRGGASSWQDAQAKALASPLEFDPGTAFRYSNTNFVLLGSLIEQRTGVPYERAIRERVLEPLGITDMRMAGTFDTQPGDVFHPSTAGRNYMEALGPAGQWIATPTDMLQVAIALQEATLVTPASRDLMETAVPLVPPNVAAGYLPWNYGLGLRLWSDGSWGHTGTIEHAKGIVLVRPDGWSVAILDNGDVPYKTDDLLSVIEMALHSMGG